jgi:phasin family protein
MASAAPEAKSEAKIDQAKAAAAAEKAYAEAAAKVEAPKAAEAAPVAPKAEVKPVEATPVAKVAAPMVAPAKKPAAAKKVAATKAAKRAVTKKAATKTVAAPKKIARKVAAKKAVKVAAPKSTGPAAKPAALTFKDTIMTKTKTATTDFTAKVQEVVSDAQARAKAAFEKSQTVFADAGEFTKGNVEALVASGKIVAAGLQEAGKDYVAEAKTALETVQADVKELAAVKSPADFFKLQGEILRRNFDASVATASKNSEKIVKLANEAFAPISTRVSLAVEKVKQAA